MKFIAWLFNYTSRHYRDIVSYNKGKLLGRIFILILELILVGGCFAIWCWAKAQDEFLKLLLISIFVFMPVVYMSIDYSFLYIILGFRMFIVGSIDSIVEKAERKRRKKNEEFLEYESEKEPEIRNHKFMDLFIGIVSIIAFVASIFSIFLVLNIYMG